MAKGRKTGGRQKGSPNKTTASVKDALNKAFSEGGGMKWFVGWAQENPTDFFKLWAKMLPTEHEITGKDGSPLPVPILRIERHVERPALNGHVVDS